MGLNYIEKLYFGYLCYMGKSIESRALDIFFYFHVSCARNWAWISSLLTSSIKSPTASSQQSPKKKF